MSVASGWVALVMAAAELGESAVELAVEHGFVTNQPEDAVVVGETAGQGTAIAVQVPGAADGVKLLAPMVHLGRRLLLNLGLGGAQRVLKPFSGETDLLKIVKKRRLFLAVATFRGLTLPVGGGGRREGPRF